MTKIFDDTFTGPAVALPSHTPELGSWGSLSGAYGATPQTDGTGQLAARASGTAGAYAQPGTGVIPPSGEYRVRGFLVKQTDLAGTYGECGARGSWLSTNAANLAHYYARFNAAGDGATGTWELGVSSGTGSLTLLASLPDSAFAAAPAGTIRVFDLEVRANAPLQRLIVSSWDGTSVDGNGDPVLTKLGEITAANTLAALSSGGNGFPGFPAVVARATTASASTGYHLTRIQVNDDLTALVGAPTVTTAATITAAHSPAYPGDTFTVSANTVYNDQGSAIDSYERKAQSSSDGGTTWADVTGTDGTASTQAALPTYTAASGDVGDEIRYASRAHNTVGWSGWSYSNAITVTALPASPTNETKPSISGLAYPGQTLTYVPGTWTGSPTLAHTWRVDGGDSGTGATFGPIPSGDIGHAITIHETATNIGGSASIDSEAVTPQAIPDVTLDFCLTGGAGNTSAAASIGGGKSATVLTSPAALESIVGSEARDGVTDYHWLVVHNPNPVVTADVVLFISANTTSPDTTAAIALCATGIGQPPAVLASDTTAPTDAGAFSAPSTAGAGLDAGSLAPDQWRAFAVRWTVNTGAGPAPADAPDTLVIGWQATEQ